MSEREVVLIVACMSVAGCSGDSSNVSPGEVFVPTDPAVLSVGNPGADEDPTVLKAADGSLYVAWFSDRGGNSDVYITRWEHGGWIDPIRVTTAPEADFAPNLYQDDAGVFHIVWFRFQTAPPYYRWVLHNRSPDGVTWSTANETRVDPTAPGEAVEDWVPTITGTADLKLHVYFVSRLRGGTGATYDLYGADSRDGGTTWSTPARLAPLDDLIEHDHLPFAARTAGGVAIAWVRHDTSADQPWENPTSDLMVSESSDGVLWGAARNVTHDDSLGALDVFPTLFSDVTGRTLVAWLTTRSGSPKVVSLPLSDVGSYPAGVVELPLPGYSPRVVATTTPGIYLGVWVAGPTGGQDVFYRFFALGG